MPSTTKPGTTSSTTSNSDTGGAGGAVRRGSARRTAEDELDRVQLRRLLVALEAMRDGNFRKRLPVAGEGLVTDLAIAYNEIADRQQHMLSELTRVQRVAGREGRHSERLQPGLGEGGWSRGVEAANSL